MIFILISLGCVIPEAVRERPLLVAIFRHYTDIEAHHELMYPHHCGRSDITTNTWSALEQSSHGGGQLRPE